MSANPTGDDLWLKATPIAHRGLHNNESGIPENAISAFEKAVQHHYAIELDVYVTLGKEVIVFHDENLKRMCAVSKSVYTVTANDRKNFKLLNTNQQVPLLRQVFDLVNGRVPILIEIKNQTVKNANQIILKTLAGYNGRVAIQSFDPFIMGWFARNAPSYIRGQLSSNFKGDKINVAKKYLLKKLAFNFISKPNFIAYDLSDLPNRLIQKKKEQGMPILCWTVKSEEAYQQISPFCDNIIFEGFMP